MEATGLSGIMNSREDTRRAKGVKLHLISEQRKRDSGKRMRWKDQIDRYRIHRFYTNLEGDMSTSDKKGENLGMNRVNST